MHSAEAYNMPSLFEMLGYRVFFWSNENNEPIHVHISKGVPSANSAKVWLTKRGECLIADNGIHIPEKDLAKLMDAISAQYFLIYARWKEHFAVDTIHFYC